MKTIQIACHCGATYLVSDEYAGKLLRCKHCDQAIRVPLVSGSTNRNLDSDVGDKPRRQKSEPTESSKKKSSAHASAREERTSQRQARARQSRSKASKSRRVELRSGRFRVRGAAIKEFFEIGDEKHLNQLADEVLTYLLGDDSTFRTADLVIRIVDWECNTHNLFAEVQLTGTINGRSIDESHSIETDLIAERRSAASFNKFASPFAYLASNRATDRMEREGPKAAGWHNRKKALDQIKGIVELHFDVPIYAAVGVKPGTEGERWATVGLCAVCFGLFIGLIAFVMVFFLVGIGPPVKLFMLLRFSGFLAVACLYGYLSYLMVVSISILWFDDRFLMHNPAGRSAMRFSGAKSARAGKIHGVVISILCAILLVGSFVGYFQF